jgi:hypothetical protein
LVKLILKMVAKVKIIKKDKLETVVMLKWLKSTTPR